MKNLKSIRIIKGFKQKDVAEHLKMTASSYSKYERGETNPDPDTLKKLSEFFNIAPAYLLGMIDEPLTLEELKVWKEIPHRSNEELIKDYNFVNDAGVELSANEVKEILDILRKKRGKKDVS